MHIQVRAYVTGYYLLTKQLVKVKSAKQLGPENTPAGLLDIFKTISVKVLEYSPSKSLKLSCVLMIVPSFTCVLTGW